MSSFRLLTGMKDILPAEVSLWQRVERVARDYFHRYFYQEIRTPIMEPTSLFARGIGENTGVVQKEMYTFMDKGNESVTLRPEGTASVVRSFLEHHLSKEDPIAKLYYMGPMFRYERPQKGRFRQFHQLGVELLGTSSALADAEVITMLDGLVRALGISSFTLQINSLGCGVCRQPFEEKLVNFLNAKKENLCVECQGRIERNPLRVFDCKKESCRSLLVDAPLLIDHLCEGCKTHFDLVEGGLKGAKVPYEVNPRIARGLDYYQRTAFELVSSGLGAQNSFAGGGRYDGLVQELGGPATPGVGFAIGLERLILLMPQIKEVEGKKLYLAFADGVGHCKAIALVHELRQAGVVCEMDYEARSLKSQMRRADKLGVTHVVILGEQEVQKGSVQLKTFATKEQVEVSFENLGGFLKES